MENVTKHILLTLLLAFSLLCKETNAQPIIDNAPWCPPGATWIYKQNSQTYDYYIKLAYEKDTVINNVNTKKLIASSISFMGIEKWQGRSENIIGYEFLAESNDSIFWYDKISHNFNFIYSFNPHLGDTIIVGNSRARCLSDSSFPLFDTLLVTSLSIDTFDNRIFNYYNTSWDRRFYLGTIISNIGSFSCPFPEISLYPNICAGFTQTEYSSTYANLVCYQDFIRGNIQFFNYINDCHAIRTGVYELPLQGKKDNAYLLYPNPANNMLNIVSLGNKQIQHIGIYNTSGSLMFESNEIDKINSGIDVAHLSNGLYVIKIAENDGNSSVYKFLKR